MRLARARSARRVRVGNEKADRARKCAHRLQGVQPLHLINEVLGI